MLFYGVLLYVGIYYSQIGARIPALASLRPEFLVGAAILAALVPKLLAGRGVSPAPEPSPLGAPTVMLFAVMVLSIPTSYWKGKSVETMIEVFKYFALYLMIVGTVDDEKKLRRFLWVYMAMVLLIVGEPLLGVFTGTASFDTHRGYGRLLGVTGLWRHPNSLGGFAAGNLGLVYYLWRGEQSRLGRLALLGIGASCLGTIVFTGSRTAYVGVLGVVAIIWFFGQHRVRNFWIAVAFLAAAWVVLPGQYKAQFLTLEEVDDVIRGEEGVDGSMAARWQIIEDAWAIFLDHPIIGVGVDAFPTARGQYFDRWQNTHNLYLQILTELGIVGGFAFAFLIRRILGTLRLARSVVLETVGAQAWPGQAALGVTAFLLTRLVIGTFGMDLYENYWWLAAGLAVVLLRLAVKARDGAPAEAPADAVESRTLTTSPVLGRAAAVVVGPDVGRVGPAPGHADGR